MSLLEDVRSDDEVIRVVTSSDPGGAISACLTPNFCVASMDYGNYQDKFISNALSKLLLFCFPLLARWRGFYIFLCMLETQQNVSNGIFGCYVLKLVVYLNLALVVLYLN